MNIESYRLFESEKLSSIGGNLLLNKDEHAVIVPKRLWKPYLADVFWNVYLFSLLNLTDQLLFLKLNSLKHGSQEHQAVDSKELRAHSKL
jgi:hypothetical protein